MKTILLIATILFSAASFAGVESSINQVEKDHNARCEYKSTSWAFCPGATFEAKVCFYSVKYKCASATEGNFITKVKVKSYYDQDLKIRVEKVRKVKIKK